MPQAEAVTMNLPKWLLDEAHEALEREVGPVSDEVFKQALGEMLQRLLERISGGYYDPRCPERAQLVSAYRTVRRTAWKKDAAAAARAAAR